MMEDHAGRIWLGLQYGVVACVIMPEARETDDLESLARDIRFRTITLGTPLNSVRDLFEREDGRILVASDSGLIVLDPETSTASRLHLTDPLGRRLDSLSLQCIALDHQKNLWIGLTHPRSVIQVVS
jgi:hypothetical protein